MVFYGNVFFDFFLFLSFNSFSTCAPDGHLLTVTIPDAVLIQFYLLRMSKILLETC